MNDTFLGRYEDLVCKPEETISMVCEYIGKPYEQSMLYFYKNIPSCLATNKWHYKLLGPITSSLIGNSAQLSGRDIEYVESACAAGMEALGYQFICNKPRRSKSINNYKSYFQVYDAIRFYFKGLERHGCCWLGLV